MRATRPLSAGDWTAAHYLAATSDTPGATLAAPGSSVAAEPCSGYHIPSGKRVSRALESISCSNKEVDQSDEEISHSTIAVTPRGERTHRSVIESGRTGAENLQTLIGTRR